MIEIKDFKKVANVPQEIINKYENILSEEIIEFWKDYGLGTFFEAFYEKYKSGRVYRFDGVRNSIF